MVGRGLSVACPRPASPLLMGFSESNVRHPRAPPSNASRQPAGLPRPLCGCPKPASSLHPRAPPANVSAGRSLAHKSFFYGLPKATRPLCGLSEACLFSSPTGPARKRFCRPQLGPQSFFYGLPKATLDTHGPGPQTLLGSRQACPGLSVACPKPASSLHPRAPPANVSAGRSLAHKASSMGFRRQRGLSVACPKPASSLHPRAPPANVSAGRSLAHKAFSIGFRRQR